MPNFFMFVVTGERTEAKRGSESAREVLMRRIESGRWPLNPRTPHQRDLQAGDRVVFYLSGSKELDRSSFVATAIVLGERVKSERQEAGLPAWLGTARSVLYDVPVGSARVFERPVPAPRLVEGLEFVKNKEKWGTYFQGGVRKIPQIDFETIVAAALKQRSA